MAQSIAQVSLMVRDYDEAIDFYIQKLNFRLKEDTRLSETKRWVTVAPKGDHSCAILLMKATNEEQVAAIGNQTGGKVFLFLHTDNLEKDCNEMLRKGVEFIDLPNQKPHGKVAIFKDLYGNKWDFIEPNN